MKRLQLSLLSIVAAFSLFPRCVISNLQIIKSIGHADSLLLESYKNQIKKEYVQITDSMTKEQVDSLFSLDRRVFGESKVSYSADRTFKIFTIEVESCGAYCNSSWFSWIHYNLKGTEKAKEMNLGVIDSIYKLSDNNYLVVSMNWGRPSSNYFVRCINANLIAIENDSLKTLAINYKKENTFGFCQESSVQTEIEPFIKYDHSKKSLTYQYANNDPEDNKPDVDIIRKGYFIYKGGKFIFLKETTSVNNRPNKS